MDESDKLAEKIGIVVQGGQVTIHTVNLGQSRAIPPKPPAADELPACPYRGLSDFQEEHAEFFFGRDVFIENLVKAVETKPLIAVVGASGSGKSSLVFAGLLPNLLQQGGWCIFKLRPASPDSRPFHNLTAALLPLSGVPNCDPLALRNQRAEALRQGDVSLQDVIAEILRQAKGAERVLLVVDQFEELYTLCSQDDRERFIDVLLAGVKDAPCQVVLTLRADFCGQAYAYRPLVDELQDADLKLGSMNRKELQAAIEAPAQKMGVQLDAGLTQQILEDVGKEPGNLPLLEFALTRLWDKQQSRALTHKAYSEIGGVKQALADYAEAIYSKLTGTEPKQAQQIFVQLVQLGEGTADTRRLATRAEISDDCWQLITRKDGLADRRLVVTGRNDQTSEETVEVVHEALIREWQRLRQWIDADRKKLLQKNEIEAQAKRWSEQKSKDYLLQGKRLQEAKAFQKEQTSYLALSPLSAEFIQKSLQKRRNARLQLIGLGLVAPLGLATFLGFQIQRQIVIGGHWETIEKAQGQRDSPARVAALQELVKYRVSLANLSLNNANLSRANLIDANLSGADLRDADLINADLRDANLIDANLSGADLSNAVLFDAYFGVADLIDADLSDADLFDANLGGADLSDADLSGADLSRADLSDADLSGANLSRADLSDAYVSCSLGKCTDFRGAKNLTPEQVKSAKNWEQAIYDPAFCQQLGLKDCKTKQPRE